MKDKKYLLIGIIVILFIIAALFFNFGPELLTWIRFDFLLSLYPQSGFVVAGNSLITTLTTRLISPMTFSCLGLPNGSSCSFSPLYCRPTCSYKLTISTSNITPVGTYNITVIGIFRIIRSIATYKLTVLPSPSPSPCAVFTNDSADIETNQATLNGNLSNLGGGISCDVFFEWGTTTSYVNTTPQKTVTIAGAFSANIAGLSSNTTYYFRAVAENSAGRSYGEGKRFTTLSNSELIWLQATSSAAWSPRNNYNNGLVYNNKMWILGGGADEGYMGDVWYSSNGINWIRTTEDAWPGRKNHTPLVYDNKMWVLGGADGSTVKNDVWYSSDGINWTQAASSTSWSPRHAYASVVYNNKMWILGGMTADGIKNDVWYSSDGINWTEATSSAPWSARAYFSMVIYQNKMWVLGGTEGGVEKNDVWYSSDGINWTQATSTAGWSARLRHTSVIFNNKIWVFGGVGFPEGFNNDVWYSTDGINWTEATSSAPWSQREQHTAVVYNNKIWILGGIDNSGLKNDVWHGE